MDDSGGTRVWSVWIVVLANILFVALAFNPWFDRWSDEASTVLVLEGLLLVLVGIPVILIQMVVRKKSFRESVTSLIETVMDFLAGAV